MLQGVRVCQSRVSSCFRYSKLVEDEKQHQRCIRPRSYLVPMCTILLCFLSIDDPGPVRADDSTRAASKWEEIRRWKFEIEIEVPRLNGLRRDGRRYFLRKIIAAAAPGEFYHYLGHHMEGDPWDREPRNQEAIIHQGERTHQWKFNRQLSVRAMSKGESLPGSLPEDTFFLVVPVWPLSDFAVPRDHNTDVVFVIGEALRSGKYSRTEERQEFGGEMCVRLQSDDKSDSIWVSEEKDLCILQREIRQRETGALRQRIVTSRIAEIAAGVWMPVEFTSTVYEGRPSKVRVTASFRVLKWELNDEVSPGMFEPNIRPGSIEMNKSGEYRQVSDGGTDLLDDVVQHLSRVEGLPHKNSSSLWSSYRIMSAIAGCVVGFLLGMIVLKMTGARSGAISAR